MFINGCTIDASFSNILKATVNDEVSLESGSLTKSQKNFSSVSSPSNNRSPVATQRGSPVAARRREATEEEAERSDPRHATVCFHSALDDDSHESQRLFWCVKVYSAGEPGSDYDPALVQTTRQETAG